MHEDFHFRVTNGQRAEVKRALHCEGISLLSASASPQRSFLIYKRITPTTTNLYSPHRQLNPFFLHIHTCCCIAVQDPLYLSPLTTCNRNVETLVQRHSCLRSLTSWAKCLRNAPCQCTAHATASADIGLFKSESVPRTGIFSPNKHEISIRSRKPEGYRLRYYILRFAGRLSWSITFRLVFSLLNLHY